MLDPVSPGDVLYELFRDILYVEMEYHLGTIGHPMANGRHGELIVAKDSNQGGRVIGFLLYCPLRDVTGQCGVYYAAVLPGFRRRGAFKSMLLKMLSRYPVAALSCEIDLVPLYERFGFEVYGHRGGQIQMATGNCDTGAMLVLDPSILEHSPVIEQRRQSLIQRCGQDAFVNAVLTYEQETQRRAERAKGYAEGRKADQLLF
jgi:GNAT superfamily N-acetyltransferase